MPRVTADTEPRAMGKGLWLAFLFSGAAALLLEVVWSRKLHLIFGGSAVATSAVLAAYMGGLALGSILVAPVMRARWHPAAAYGVMELAIAAYALILPPLMDAVAPLLPSSGEGHTLTMAVRFLGGGALLLFPTALMGATLPCLAELAQGDAGSKASSVGVLYAANTLGAVLGTLLATFVTFPAVGVLMTNAWAAGTDALVGVGALLWWLRAGRPGPLSAARIEPHPTSTHHAPVLWAYALSGGVAMALEVLWTRSLSMVVGSSLHAFSLMLAAFLLGLALGARLASTSWVSDYRPRHALGVALALTGVLAFGGTWLIDQIPWLVFEAARSPDLDEWTMWAVMLLGSGLVMFPAALGFGAILPLTLRCASSDAEPLGALVSRAYAINTGGAIAGALLAGFVLGPGLGLDRAAQALCVVLLGAGAWLVASQGVWAAGMVVFAAAVATWDGFDVGRWSVGAFRVYLARSAWTDGMPTEANVIFRKDGLSTTVTVEEYNGRVSLKVNGKTDASSEGDMPTQVLSGLLPVLLHPHPQRAAIVGFGSGVTSDAILSYPDLQSLTMVELEPAVVEAGEFFASVNRRPWQDGRYHGVFDDGRHHLAQPGPPLDIIISEPSNPWITGASSLFTQEFWTLARTRLAEDGIFLQWIQLYELSTERIQSLMGTFANVFPHVLLFAAHPDSNDTLLVGSRQPMVMREDLMRARWMLPTVRWQLERADMHSPMDVATLLLMDDERLAGFIRGATLNTDDNLYVELNAPRDLIQFSHKEPELPFFKSLAGRREALLRRNLVLEGGWDTPAAMARLADATLRTGMLDDAQAFSLRLVGQGGEWERQRERVVSAMGVLRGDDEIPVIDEASISITDQRYLRVLRALLEDDDRKALELFEAFPGMEKERREFRLLYAYLLYRNNWRWRSKEIMEPLLQDLSYRRAHLPVLYYGARIQWLADENQRAARLALELADIQAARRQELLDAMDK